MLQLCAIQPGRGRMIYMAHTQFTYCRLFVEHSHIFCALDVCLGDAHCLSSRCFVGVCLICCRRGKCFMLGNNCRSCCRGPNLGVYIVYVAQCSYKRDFSSLLGSVLCSFISFPLIYLSLSLRQSVCLYLSVFFL